MRLSRRVLVSCLVLGVAACSGGDDADPDPIIIEDPPEPAVCGNGTIELGEECDGAAAATCLDRGFAAGEMTCGADCRLDASFCIVVSCTTGSPLPSAMRSSTFVEQPRPPRKMVLVVLLRTTISTGDASGSSRYSRHAGSSGDVTVVEQPTAATASGTPMRENNARERKNCMPTGGASRAPRLSLRT